MVKEKIKDIFGENYFHCVYEDCQIKTQHSWYRYNGEVFGRPQCFYPGMGSMIKPEEEEHYADNDQLFKLFKGYEIGKQYRVSVCQACKRPTFWFEDKIIYPLNHSDIDEPNPYMPEEVKNLYLEAKSVFYLSYKSAAALLRLALEHLLLSLLKRKDDHESVSQEKAAPLAKRKNISLANMIRELVSYGKLSKRTAVLLDAIRVLGNDGVHVGIIKLEDDEKKENILQLFAAMNLIITETYQADEFVKQIHSMVPESKKIVKIEEKTS